jgi:epoxyqueuosine reductase
MNNCRIFPRIVQYTHRRRIMMDNKTFKNPDEAVKFVESEIVSFVHNSPLNRMPGDDIRVMFDKPMVRFAAGDDPIFTQYKTVISPNHLTPREALALSLKKNPADLPATLSVISWILPITAKTRQSNRGQTIEPSLFWANTRWYGEQFNDALHNHVVKLLTEKGYLATAPALQPYLNRQYNEKGAYTNWSHRHIAYAAGHGTFSLSDGFITEKGIAHRTGSVVTDLVLPPSPRTANTPFANCLPFVGTKCRACIIRCPAGAITESGHNKIKCENYLTEQFAPMRKALKSGNTGCGLCQTKVPCEFKNPTVNMKKVKTPA